MNRTRASTLYDAAYDLASLGMLEESLAQYRIADALAKAEAYEQEATDLERPALPTLAAPPPEVQP